MLDFVLDTIETDVSFRVKKSILRAMCKTPPFRFAGATQLTTTSTLPDADSPLNTEKLVNKLWRLLT